MPTGAAADASPEAAFRIKLLEIAEATEIDYPVFDFYLAVEIPLRDFFVQARHFPMIIQALEGCIASGSLLAEGIATATRLSEMKVFAGRWLESKRKQGHPLLACSPLCIEIHKLLHLPQPRYDL